MFLLRYYCNKVNETIKNLLEEIGKRYNIRHEILEWTDYDEEREKEVYEKVFKPRARILKKRTGKPITNLRSKKAQHYFVSRPAAIAVFRDGSIEWWTHMDENIIDFLKNILSEGKSFLEELSKN